MKVSQISKTRPWLKKITIPNNQNLTLTLSFDALSKWHVPDITFFFTPVHFLPKIYRLKFHNWCYNCYQIFNTVLQFRSFVIFFNNEFHFCSQNNWYCSHYPLHYGRFLCLDRWFSVGICKYKPGYKSHDLLYINRVLSLVEITAFRLKSKSCKGFPPMRDLEFLTVHVTFKLRYNRI